MVIRHLQQNGDHRQTVRRRRRYSAFDNREARLPLRPNLDVAVQDWGQGAHESDEHRHALRVGVNETA